MTNKEITKVIFNNAEISALYYGDVLIWEKGNTAEYGVNTLAGKFTDDSTESDWYWEPNKTFYLQSNKINIADKVDPTTKEFCFDYTVNNLMCCFNNKKIEKIYHLPLCKGNDLYNMIYYCPSLTSINLSDFDTSNCTNMESMFSGCIALTSLDLSNFDTSKVTNMKKMFHDCNNLQTLDLSNFDTSKVTKLSDMFSMCESLTPINLSNFDTSNVTNMDFLFQNCTSLTSLDLSNFDTSNCTNMESMFSGCKALTSLDLSNFDTSKVTNMRYLFYNCYSLETLNLNFNTTAVTNMGSMFYYCSGLTTVTGVFEGTKVDLDLHFSPLTNASAMVFINGLANVEETKTITFKSTTYNTLTEEQIAVATSKGWTVISA